MKFYLFHLGFVAGTRKGEHTEVFICLDILKVYVYQFSLIYEILLSALTIKMICSELILTN